MSKLFEPIDAGSIPLANRVVMAPLTRSRSPGSIPNDLNVEYYRQRASAGLIISEGTPISEQGQGYADVPGLFRKESITGWKDVTDTVHKEGGKIVAQIWHVGRVSHTSLQPHGGHPVAPSALPAKVNSFIIDNKGEGVSVPASEPRALTLEGIEAILDDFGTAAKNALEAGFDGVEIHAANGYLIEQFLKSSSNQRTDDYGGSIENRARFLLQVVDRVANTIGGSITGIRLSPTTSANDIQETNPHDLYNYVIDELAKRELAFIHIIEGQTGGERDYYLGDKPFDYQELHKRYVNTGAKAIWIANNGYTRELALSTVEEGKADAIAFGRAFISNPDLVARLKNNLPITPANPATFYGGGAEGYIDYPAAD